MPISYYEDTRVFHLFNEHVSYMMHILENGAIAHLFFGSRLHDHKDYTYMVEMVPRSMAVCRGDDMAFSMEHIRQEYPCYGHGDMRHAAFTIESKTRSVINEFIYQSHTIQPGKPSLNGLPATYCEDKQEATTLQICLYDEVLDANLTLSYTIFENLDVIARNTCFHSHTQPFTIQNAMSMNVDLPDANYEMIKLTGAWARERHMHVERLDHGLHSIYSMRGCSSANFNPFLALQRSHTTETQGEVYGFSFVYSGNFLASVDVDTYDTARVRMGLHPDTFRWNMGKEETFQTPEALMVYSAKGRNPMSQTFHKLFTTRLIRGVWRDQPRPILLNNWEATYFDFDENKLLALAKQASKLGIELFVLDDGWFQGRNDDTTSLGDWVVDRSKLVHGLSGLSKQIRDMGMQFGIWIEPEMVNKESELYQKHPEWVLHDPKRTMSQGRHQYVLDFANPNVVSYLYEQLTKIFEEGCISYVKWDMNRCMSEVFSSAYKASEQGSIAHRYILGVYALYERLNTRFPNILFESCAGGGSRFDPGMLYYAPQAWTSDNTDAMERLKIQYGSSLVYPLCSMGSHVSAVPNHQVGRTTPLSTRANVAYFGTFGYELDVTALNKEEKAELQTQIQFMKKYRELLQFGTFYRLLDPIENNSCAWMVVDKDKQEAIVGYYRIRQSANQPYVRIQLQGLDPNMRYQIDKVIRYGDELMQYGLYIDEKDVYGDGTSHIYKLQTIVENKRIIQHIC